jgi:hypothetical protein
VRAPTRWFPRSLSNRWTGSAPSYAPATSPRLRRSPSPWPPDRRHHPTMEFPARPSRAGTRCCPAQIRQVRAGGFVLRSVQPLVPHVRLSVLLAGPGPSGSADPSRRCQGCFPPSAASPASGCPQLQWLAATSPRRCPFTTARFKSTSWRSMSVTHNWSGPPWAKSRSTRSAATWSGLAWRHLGRPEPRPGRCGASAGRRRCGRPRSHGQGAARRAPAGRHRSPRVLVHLDAHAGQPGVADRAGRRWPGPPGVEGRGVHIQDPAGHLDRDVLGGHHRDRLEPPLGAPPLGPAPWPPHGA